MKVDRYQRSILRDLQMEVPKTARSSSAAEKWYRAKASDESVPSYVQEVALFEADQIKANREALERRAQLERERMDSLRASCESYHDSRLNQTALDAIWSRTLNLSDTDSNHEVEETYDELHALAVELMNAHGVK